LGPLAAIAAMQIFGGFLRANAARRAARMQAAQDRRNATIAEFAGGDALQRGSAEEGAIKQATSERISSDQAQLGASGVDVRSGSALDTLSGQRMRGALTALRARSNATRLAWGYRTEADNLRFQGDYAEYAGDQAFKEQLLGGGLQGAGSLAQGNGGAGVAYPIIRIGEPTTFERPSYTDFSDQGI
jgi:hypothetical protein